MKTLKDWAVPTLMSVAIAGAMNNARADVVTDWNAKAGELIIEARLGTPPAVRVMALVQTAVYDSANAVTRRYAGEGPALDAPPGASLDAAVAAANRTVLLRLLPQAQHAAIEAAYQQALAAIGEGPARTAGVALGDKAAQAVLARRADDAAAAAADTYRPLAAAGTYVPTVTPAVTHWPQRRPWLLSTPAQFRPGPPPALASDTWARDFNEIKAFGGKTSTRRSAEQTEVARFWEFSLPSIYHGVVRSVALQPGRDATRNARLYAAVAQGMDDAMISVFDAKYHYNFWRPTTAIRNGDNDGNPATERDAGWAPFIDAPMHPEYPSAHAILASTVATLLQVDSGAAPLPELSTSSPSAKNAVRRWNSADEFMREVADARVWEGVHYRTSTEVGLAMGRQIGQVAADRHLRPAP